MRRVEEYEIDLDDLMKYMSEDLKKNAKTFEDLVVLDGCLNRELYLDDIGEGAGSTIDGYIRFWNLYDEKRNIPVEERKPIKIYINSNGGSLIETFIIIDSIEMSKTPVWTIAVGATYSGGFFSFIAGHKRFAYPHASFLYHEGSTGQTSDAGKFRNYADFYMKQLDQLKNITLKYTGMTEEYYTEHQRDDLWLTAEEALELSVCDEIAEELV